MIQLLLHPAFGIVAFLAVVLIIVCVNAISLIHMDRCQVAITEIELKNLPFLSVLVPARNEEENITPCVQSLLSQDYPNYEVLVLDDHSTDRTGLILAGLAAGDNRLRVLQGEKLPEGWLGKNWACHQLAQAASGELILFIDADTVHHPATLKQGVCAMSTERIEMLTALPRQEVLTWGERLIVPILYFCLMVFIPLPLAYRLKMPFLSAAIGQFMLFDRSAYDEIGGYASIQNHGTDDLALAQRIKRYHLPWRMADGGNTVRTRMYRNFSQAYNGLSKNLFAVFDYRILPFLFAWIWMGYIFFRPLVELALTGTLLPPNTLIRLLDCIAILEALILWGLVIFRWRFPRYLFLLYPLIVLTGIIIAFRSLWLSLRGQATWKGRMLERPAVRWI